MTLALDLLRRIDPALPRVLGIVLAIRVGLGLEGWLVTALRPGDPGAVTWDGLRIGGGGVGGALLAPWQRDDALWFQHIAERGYGHDPSAAFLPLYPAAVHTVALALGGATLLAALVISTAAAVGGLTLLHRLVRDDLGTRVADRSVLYLAVAPWAFFLLAPYAEAMFLLLAVGTMLCVRRGRYGAAAVLAALAAITRIQGVLLVVPILVEIAVLARHDPTALRRHWRGWSAAVLLPLAAAALFQLYLRQRLGFAGGSPQVEDLYWHNAAAAPWTVLGDSLRTALSGGHPEEMVNLVTMLLLLAAIPLMARRLPLSYTALTVAMVVPLLLREDGYSPLMSDGRFALAMFPVFILLADLGVRSPRTHRVVVLAFPVLMALFFADFVRFHLVG